MTNLERAAAAYKAFHDAFWRLGRLERDLERNEKRALWRSLEEAQEALLEAASA